MDLFRVMYSTRALLANTGIVSVGNGSCSWPSRPANPAFATQRRKALDATLGRRWGEG